MNHTEDKKPFDPLEDYKKELIELLHKSQESFEKQLSYISAGTLVISMGFIKDVVGNIDFTKYKWLLTIGWILLGATLLINLISHIRAADKHNTTIKEIDEKNYNRETVRKRYTEISNYNWTTVATLLCGILLIIIFVSINI
jgi:hypothetical protein